MATLTIEMIRKVIISKKRRRGTRQERGRKS